MTFLRLRSNRWLALCGTFAVVAIAIGTAAVVASFRERALANSLREHENTVLLLTRHVDHQLLQLDQVQRALVDELQAEGIATHEHYRRRVSGIEMHRVLKAKIDALSHVSRLGFNDAEGMRVNSSVAWPSEPISIADRSYFTALQSDPGMASVLSEPLINRVTGTWSIILARKVTGPNGEFWGAILGSIELAHFEEFVASILLKESSSIALFRTDGTLIMRYPRSEALIGKRLDVGSTRQRLFAGQEHGTFRAISPIDGQERLGAVRKLRGHPVFLSATTTIPAALADWHAQTRFLIGISALAIVVIASILFLIARQVSREYAKSERTVEIERNKLDLALNNMTQGLLLYDSSEHVVVCNKAYRDMFGLSPNVVRPGIRFRDLIAHREKTGSFNGDVDAYCSSILRNIALGKTVRSIVTAADGRVIQMVNRPMATGGWVATMEDVTELKYLDERIAHMAHYDALTDLPNRVLFRERLGQALESAGSDSVAVLYIDVDQFKGVNDSLGHLVGDELLKSIAARLRDCVGESGLVSRLGGDEFAVLQTRVTQDSDVTDLVAHLYEAIRGPHDCSGHRLSADASIGVALAHADTDQELLLRRADLAMYAAKSSGRRTYRFFDLEMEAQLLSRRALEQDLRQSLLDGDFEVHYQPIVSLQTQRITTCEALLRWRHPVRGMVPPSEFISLAEDTGLIDQLGEWVLRTACTQAVTWPADVKVAVNVSPVQFKSGNLAFTVATALAESGLTANRLELEITEAVLLHDDEVALLTLDKLRRLGVRIALDDFGTGYSSLGYLQRFSFDKIKIDRSFVRDVTHPGGSSPIVQAIANIAAARDMTTTAEGVETEEQRVQLKLLGCHEMQGYLYSRPLTASDISRKLASAVWQKAAVA